MAAIENLEQLQVRLRELAADIKDVRKPLEATAVYMIGSVEKNFQAQGRPDKWTPLSPRTLEMRRKGKARRSAKILIDSGRLKNSIDKKIEDDSVEIGTNVIYARRQHFGYDPGGKKGRGQVKTPARPFLMFQQEDFQKIEKIFQRHVTKR